MNNRLNDASSCRVKPILAYLKDSIKFYDIQNPFVAQIIFILQLAILFSGYVFSRPYMQEFYIAFEQVNVRLQEQLQAKALDMSLLTSDIYISMINSFMAIVLVLFVVKSLSSLISLFYGTYYYYGLTNSTMKGAQKALIFFKRLPKIIVFNILFYVAFYFVVLVLVLLTGIITMIIPIFSVLTLALPLVILALNTVFTFKDLLIIEFDIGIFRNFKKSLDLTKGCKKNVILNSLWPLCMGWLLSFFAVDIQNALLSLFIAAFLEVIILLISQRLTALMFIDAASLERQDKKPVKGTEQG